MLRHLKLHGMIIGVLFLLAYMLYLSTDFLALEAESVAADEVSDDENSDTYVRAISQITPLGFMVTGVEDSIVISVETVEEADGYEVYESIDSENFTLAMSSPDIEIVLSEKGFNENYTYYVQAYEEVGSTRVYSQKSERLSASTAPEGAVSTIKTLLKTGIAPMGSTMYIWGGGWNEADDGAGPTTMQIGISSTWREFAKEQDASYDFNNHRYQIHDGLDCSGYLGFINYNILNTESGNEGYVTWAADTGPYLADLGLGVYTNETLHTSYLPGDVLYNDAHVYIVIGRASDSSLLIMHASPKGVKLSGTPTPSGESSQAAALATDYMSQYFPEYYEKDDNYQMDYSYLNSYQKFQYDTSLVADPDGYLELSAEEIMADLFDGFE